MVPFPSLATEPRRFTYSLTAHCPLPQLGPLWNFDRSSLYVTSPSHLAKYLPYLYLARTDMYYLAFPSDGYLRKCVVCVAYLIECAQTVLATRDAFRQFSSGWGNLLELDEIGLYWLSILLLTMLSAMLSQYFYAWRILILSHQRWIVATVRPIPIHEKERSCISRRVSTNLRLRQVPEKNLIGTV